MKNLDCIQIEIFINLEIIGEEDKNKKKKIYIYIYIRKFNKISTIWWSHVTQPQIVSKVERRREEYSK